ncbi:thioredoxin domain-containing protein, partial [Nonomuraea sp. NPDC005983]|uniref:DsbA family protein n=1 Tax=Nonomuraea sp. NPDC005983 TaxID=3155595 RepID=UPI0033AFA41A
DAPAGPASRAGSTSAATPATGTGQTAAASAEPTGSPVPTWEGPTPPPIDPKLSKGSDRAPVTIVEFGDFNCPNCRHYAQTIAPALQREYLDRGVIRIFWRDSPIRGRDSMRAAVAGRAAARQGRFWEFHDAVFAGRPRLDDEGLRAAATRAGLDVAKFDADRRDPALKRLVDADLNFALQLGLPGTPAFLINGRLLFGAQPLATFKRAIEKAR